MSGRVVPLGASAHQTAQALLPWFVTDTLGPQEKALVQEHLRTCSQCQADCDWQHRLRAASLQTEADARADAPAAAAAFSRLRQRMQAQPDAAACPTLPAQLRSAVESSARWMRWLLAGQAAIIALLAVLVMLPSFAPLPYHALGAPDKTGSNLVVTFRPDATEQQIRRILRDSGARIVGGPTAADAWLLHVPSDRREQAIAALRALPAVTLAVPLDSGDGP